MKPLSDAIPAEFLATPEERERAVARWENEIRPEIAPGRPVSGQTVLAEALRFAAAKRLEELQAAADEPIAIGEGLAKILAALAEAEAARR
jgi:hypothetical protein